MWAIFGGPMILATDPRNMSAWKASVVLNQDILAINNDSLAAPGARVYNDNTTAMTQIWAKPLASGQQAVVLLNANDFSTQTITVSWDQLGWPAAANVSVYDCWAHAYVGAYVGSYSAAVVSHGNAMLRLTQL